MLEALHRDRAGRSAYRQYQTLARAWRDRVFGRRFTLYFWTILVLLLILVATHHLSMTWSLPIGIAFGAAAASWALMPEALMPGHISNWRNGAWGEQNTKSELAKLKREGWTIRHDLRWGKRANHDHVAAGNAVYVLNSKNVKDSIVTVEGEALRVTHIDGDNSYLADRWAPQVAREARSLKVELEKRVGFPVHVYAVLVIWGRFDIGQTHLGEVSVVCGGKVTDWLLARPSDLLMPEKRQAVAEAVTVLPRA